MNDPKESDKVCPNCGHCPTCGRTAKDNCCPTCKQPYDVKVIIYIPWFPYYPYYIGQGCTYDEPLKITYANTTNTQA